MRLIVFILFCFPVLLTAQKREGEVAFNNRRWSEALQWLNQYQAQKPGDIGVLSKIGICHYRLHQPERAKQVLEYVARQPKGVESEVYYYFARTLHGLMEWEKAIEAYKQFLRQAPADHVLRANVRDNIRRCISGMSTMPDESVALVENFGTTVNTAGDEFAPLPSRNFSNRFYFSAARPGTVGGQRDEKGYTDTLAGNWCSDMLITERTNRGWSMPKSFSSLQNTSRYESALDFTNEGRVLYFFKGFSLFAGEIYTDTAGLNDEYTATPHPWSGPMMPEKGDEAPFFYNDTTVIFASRRTGGLGGLDLYVSTRGKTGNWSEPLNLGPMVNSDYDDTSPFIARDGITLYFSSNRTDGIGGMDVYRSAYDAEKRTWTPAQPLGVPINSPGDETGFRLSADGRSATFASDRLVDNYGQFDLYMAYFKEERPEQASADLAFAFLTPVKTVAATGPLEVVLAPLLYNNDRDVLRPENLKTVDQMAALARNFPNMVLTVTAFTDESGSAKFDLYNGIKRAELVGKALTDRGIPASRLVLRSAGSGFPIARDVLNGSPNPAGQQLNRRLEISATGTQGSALANVRVVQQPTEINEAMVAPGYKRLTEQTTGLYYRVEMISTGQVLTADALGLFTDLIVESVAGTGQYHYLTGHSRNFAGLAGLKKDVLAQGFNEARIVAFINGVRIEPAEAIGLVKQYPDLTTYIRG